MLLISPLQGLKTLFYSIEMLLIGLDQGRKALLRSVETLLISPLQGLKALVEGHKLLLYRLEALLVGTFHGLKALLYRLEAGGHLSQDGGLDLSKGLELFLNPDDPLQDREFASPLLVLTNVFLYRPGYERSGLCLKDLLHEGFEIWALNLHISTVTSRKYGCQAGA